MPIAAALLVLTACSSLQPLALTGEINEKSAAPLIAFFQAHKVGQYVLFIDSPGGYNGPGFALIDAMLEAERGGATVTCVVTGQAASMAAILFESACTTRQMRPDTTLFFHEAAFSPGAFVQVVAELALRGVRFTNALFLEMAASLHEDDAKAAALMAQHMCMTPEAYLEMIHGQELSVTATDAYIRGWTDEITSS
jgi:ATP-dependent protease ClpP protease subunit